MMKKIKQAAAALISASIFFTGCSQNTANTPVASIENPPEGTGDRFTVTFSDWNREYKYRMGAGGYTEEKDAELCTQLRKEVIEYLTQERVVLYLAEQMDITAASLSDEEVKKIDEQVQKNLKKWYESYEADAKLALGSDFTEDELLKKEQELFEKFLSQTGITVEDFTMWETNEQIRLKFIEKVGESVEDKTVDDFVQSTIDSAKEMYEKDIATFEKTYTAFYIPEGSRKVQQIVVMIDDISASEVKAYRKDGDDEKADEILNAALEKVKFRIDEAYEKLQNGEDWKKVQEEYNDETSTNDVDFNLYPKSSTIDKKIIEAAMSIKNKGEYSEIQKTDAGWSIICYKDDLKFTDEEIKSLNDQGREFLVQQESYKKVTDFLKDYPYVLNYELLNLEDPESTTASEKQ